MRARTIGPVLMMTLGLGMLFVPAAGGAGAQVVDPCPIGVPVLPCDPCPLPLNGFVVPCGTTTTSTTTTTTIAATTTSAAATTTSAAATTTAAAATTTAVLPSTTDIGSGGQGLPATGDTSSSYVVFGVLLMVSGAALLALGRTRPDPSTN